MLNNISELITPEIYEVLYHAGHMDEIAIVDTNFSASEMSDDAIFLPVRDNHLLLQEILKYLPIDEDEPNAINVMQPDHGDMEEPQAWSDYREILEVSEVDMDLNTLDREDFYERVRSGHATIRTSDTRLYANIIVRKGVVLAL